MIQLIVRYRTAHLLLSAMALIDAHILVVDDDEDILTSARLLLKQFFREVNTLNSPTNILPFLSQNSVNMVLLDMNFRRQDNEGLEGLKWLNRIKSFDPNIQVVPMTAYAEIDLAVHAVKKGAFDFIIKPWYNDKLIATISAALQLQKSQNEIELLKEQRSQLLADIESGMSDFIGESDSILAIKENLSKLAKSDANILITGENGTGKEVLARAIHRLSMRETGPFVSVDLGAISESLFESELFGYKKGAFTDAKTDKPGRFKLAHGGSLFLDELGNLSLQGQVKLLGVLQNKIITPLGAVKSEEVDVRIVAATNADLREAIGQKDFRQDLYYRINTVEIHLPPLRERKSDIPLLARHFIDLFSGKYQKKGLKLSRQDENYLRQQDWPGNIRELQHQVERAVIMSSNGQLDFPKETLNPIKKATELQETLNLNDLEKAAIEKALVQQKGNVSKAAKVLGLTRTALYRRMEKYDL